MSRTPADHKALLREQYEVRCDIDALAPNEVHLLERYGAWLAALAEGRISPFTEEQKAFLEVVIGNRLAQTKFECLWAKYSAQRIFELAAAVDARLGTSAGFCFQQVVMLHERAAQLGHRESCAWLENEGITLPDKSQPASLALPRIKQTTFDTGIPSRAGWGKLSGWGYNGDSRVSQGNPNAEDWGYVRDDLDSADWEYALAGPDDAYFEGG